MIMYTHLNAYIFIHPHIGTFVEHVIFRPLDQPTRIISDTASMSGDLPTFAVPDMNWDSKATPLMFQTVRRRMRMSMVDDA